MKKYFNVLKESEIFKNIAEQDFEALLRLFKANVKSYKKNEVVFDYNTEVKRMGVIAAGCCQIEKTDFEGNRLILRSINVGQSFGDTLVLSGLKKAPVTVVAATDCAVVFLSVKEIFNAPCLTLGYQVQLAKNLIEMLAQKSIALLIKSDIFSKKTLRKKLLAYFEYNLGAAGVEVFLSPFSQEELADYLSVNRSAMARELSKMRDEGIIFYEKNRITVNVKSLKEEFR